MWVATLAQAWWLYRNTTVRRRWVAERLAMGYETRISQAASYVGSSQSPGVLGLKSTLLRYEK